MFKCFYTVEGGWGEFSQQGPAGLPHGKLTLSCIWGTVELKTLGVVSSAKTATATVGSKSQPVSIAAGVITFTGGLTLAKGQSLSVTIGGGDYELRMAASSSTTTCDSTLRQRRPAWTGAPREEQNDLSASCCVPGSACCPGGVCGPDGSCCMPETGDGKMMATQPQPLSQISGLAMAMGAVLMFVLGSLLGPKLQALLDLVFGQSA